MVTVVLATNAALPEWNSDIIADQDSGAILANGIFFNHVSKILRAEKFINVDFPVPFPKFEMNVIAELGAYVNKLAPP